MSGLCVCVCIMMYSLLLYDLLGASSSSIALSEYRKLRYLLNIASALTSSGVGVTPTSSNLGRPGVGWLERWC